MECFAMADAGYFGAVSETGHYVICDAGEIGPMYNPGHAHGDIFSFELSFSGKRLIVDSGVYDYIDSTERKYDRSTAAHNTVEIDGADQCEFFDAFKVGRRAHPRNVVWKETPDGFTLEGEHDGYTSLPGRAVHRRKFRWRHEGELEITDTITARSEVEAVVRFHLHPECRIVERRADSIVFERDAVRCLLRSPGSEPVINRYDYSPEFGLKIPAMAIGLKTRGNSIERKIFLSPQSR